MTKQVQLRRKEIKSYLPIKVLANAKKTLSSVLKDRNPLGLPDKEEEKRLLSQILNMEPTDRDWAKSVREFWINFRIVVPSSGVVLDISTTKTKEGLIPDNIEDYLIYKWAYNNHPLVANSKDEATSDTRKEFYIYDPEKETSKQNQVVKNTRLAYKEFIGLAENDAKMDMVIRIMTGEDSSKFTSEMKENKLDTLLKSNPTKFLKIVTDPDLEVRADIEKMVDKGILRKQGASYLYMDTTIGDSLGESVSYFKNGRNSETVLDLKSRLKELS